MQQFVILVVGRYSLTLRAEIFFNSFQTKEKKLKKYWELNIKDFNLENKKNADNHVHDYSVFVQTCTLSTTIFENAIALFHYDLTSKEIYWLNAKVHGR